MVQLSFFLDHPFTIKKGTHIANTLILTPEQTTHIRPVNSNSVRHISINNHDDAIHYKNSLWKTFKTNEVNEIYWLPTPQNPGNAREHTHIQTRILNELREVKKLEQLIPQDDINSRKQFLCNFDWTDSTLNLQPKKPLKPNSLTFMTVLHGIALTLESIQSSKCNSQL